MSCSKPRKLRLRRGKPVLAERREGEEEYGLKRIRDTLIIGNVVEMATQVQAMDVCLSLPAQVVKLVGRREVIMRQIGDEVIIMQGVVVQGRGEIEEASEEKGQWKPQKEGKYKKLVLSCYL